LYYITPEHIYLLTYEQMDESLVSAIVLFRIVKLPISLTWSTKINR